jgi:hypothetical protein
MDLNIPLFGDDIKGRYTKARIIPFDGMINGRGGPLLNPKKEAES